MKILIPPSIGIHGGGQQFGPEGGPGWEKQKLLINRIISKKINFLYKILQKGKSSKSYGWNLTQAES